MIENTDIGGSGRAPSLANDAHQMTRPVGGAIVVNIRA
jgi:hypothetical protein